MDLLSMTNSTEINEFYKVLTKEILIFQATVFTFGAILAALKFEINMINTKY